MGHAKASTASPRCRLHCPSALPTLPNFCTAAASPQHCRLSTAPHPSPAHTHPLQRHPQNPAPDPQSLSCHRPQSLSLPSSALASRIRPHSLLAPPNLCQPTAAAACISTLLPTQRSALLPLARAHPQPLRHELVLCFGEVGGPSPCLAADPMASPRWGGTAHTKKQGRHTHFASTTRSISCLAGMCFAPVSSIGIFTSTRYGRFTYPEVGGCNLKNGER